MNIKHRDRSLKVLEFVHIIPSGLLMLFQQHFRPMHISLIDLRKLHAFMLYVKCFMREVLCVRAAANDYFY